MFWELAAEVLGTFILILLGDGVVANVGLAPRLAAGGYNWNTITIGWCFAVVIAAYAVGGISAHLNPAVTLALAVKRNFPWSKVVPFWVAQVVGAFLGAFAVYLCYRDGLAAAGMPNVWTTGPGSVFASAFWGAGAGKALGSYALTTALITEIFGTAILVIAICSADKVTNNLGTLLVGFAVLAVGLSLGGPSGYSLNPARDFGPRILGVLVGTQGLFDGIYWLVAPVIGPLIGGVFGVYVYDWIVTAGLAAKKSEETAAAKKAGKPVAQA